MVRTDIDAQPFEFRSGIWLKTTLFQFLRVSTQMICLKMLYLNPNCFEEMDMGWEGNYNHAWLTFSTIMLNM